MATWWNGRHAVVRRPCPPRREGSSSSLVTGSYRWCLWCNRRACDPVKVEAAGSNPPEHPAGGRYPVLRLQALALRRPAGQFDSGMGYCLGCLAASSAGSTKPGWQVRLLHDLLLARPSAGDGGSEPRSSWLDTSTGCSKKRLAMLDRPGTALVTRTKWDRVPPPALV